MPDYITLHASAYPPTSWTFLAHRQPKPPQTSSNELWTEMTNHYKRSMAERQHAFTSNFLSETATNANVNRMRADALKLYRQQKVMTFEDAADVVEILDIAESFVKAVDKLAENPMETILEDEFDAAESRRQPTEQELLRINQAILRSKDYQRLQDTDEIEDSFRSRLMEIDNAYYTFICTPVGKHPRPRWAQICRMDKEVTAHVALVAQRQQQLTSDVNQLKGFLRGHLFDEYCLMKRTSMEKKDKTWLQYGKCLISGHGIRDRDTGERLNSMIDASGLDPDWAMDRIEEYCTGNAHIGKWQRYVQARRWEKLAEKLTNDIKQLEKINKDTKSNNGRPCRIMRNIQHTKLQFFKRLEGARDFEVSRKALRVDRRHESPPSSSLTTSVVMVGSDC